MNEIVAALISAVGAVAGPIAAAWISGRRLAETSAAIHALAANHAPDDAASGDGESFEEAADRLEERLASAHATARVLAAAALLAPGFTVLGTSGYLGMRVLDVAPELQSGPAMVALGVVAGASVAVGTLTAATVLVVGTIDRMVRRQQERLDGMRRLASRLAAAGVTTGAPATVADDHGTARAERRRRRQARRESRG